MDEEKDLTGIRFCIVTVLNILITVAEAIGGLLSGSLSLLSDSVHNLGDSLSIILAFVASRISKQPSNKEKTFGYRRAEILASYINSIFLIVVSLMLMIEAVKRIFNPEKVNGLLMLIVAIVGLIANVLSAMLLHHGTEKSLNIKATYLHILSDALSSIGVIVGAVMINMYEIYWIDPLITMAVSIYIAYESIPIIKDTTNILMQAGPSMDYAEIKKDIASFPEVVKVHHIHTWMIDEHSIVFSAHINVKDDYLSNIEPVYNKIAQMLKSKYNVEHVTIQAEVALGLDSPTFMDNKEDYL